MSTTSARVARAAVAVSLFLFVAPVAFAAIAHKVDAHALGALARPVPKGAKVQVTIALGAEPLVLQLEKFDIFTPETEIRVLGDNDEILARLPLPNAQYFRGYLADDPDSLVFMSSEKGQFDGLILTENRRFEVQSRLRRSGGRAVHATSAVAHDVFVMESPLDDDFSAGEGFTCDVHKRPKTLGRFGALLESLGKTTSDGALSSSSNTLWQLNLALETDYELFVNSGSSSANVTSFIGNLIAATSTIYRRDLSTEVFLSYLGVHTTASDPFTVVPGATGTWNGVTQTLNSFHALLELGDRWATPGTRPFSGARSAVHLISGKSQLAGVAWVETVCQGDFLCQSGNCGSADANGHYGGAYGFNGGIDPPADNSVANPDANVNYVAPSSNYWALLEFAHELGHNVGSDHTHCIGLSASDQATYGRAYVDVCRNCATNANGTVPAEKGTIMSYCHLLGGGSQTRFTFGKNGEASAMMLPLMRGYLQTYTPTLSLITAPSSVANGVSSNASVTNVAGISYAWTITNGTISGSSTSSSVSFSATANPVTLKVTATNAGGCSVTDFVTITVTDSCTPPVITGHPQSTTITAGNVVVLSVTASGNALSYQWYRGASGSTGDPVVGATSSTLNVGPSVTSSFWVRVSNSCGAVNSNTATITVAASCSAVSIASHPQSSTITAGSVVTLSVTANGSTPSYQWYRGASGNTGDPVIGATSASLNVGPSVTSSFWVRVTNGCSSANSNTATITVQSSAARVRGDFDGDGKADLLWRRNGTGENVMWLMNGVAAKQGAFIATASSSVILGGHGDLDGDGKTDVIWRNPTTGENFAWLMNGLTPAQGQQLTTVNVNFQLAAMADFDGDGKDDILWRNDSTGENVMWLMNGLAPKQGAFIATASSSVRLAAAVDFDGDGKSDILWRNNTTGENVVWLMNGVAPKQGAFINTASTDFHLASAQDFDGDGKADLLWHKDSTGENVMWLMNGTAVSRGAFVTTINASYRFAAGSDFNGDGRGDVLWRNPSTGENVMWLFDGTTPYSGAFLTTVNVNFSAVAPRGR